MSRIELTETQYNLVRDTNINVVIEHTFPNAEVELKRKLAHQIRCWRKERLSGLVALVREGKVDEARRILLGWL